MSLIPPEAVALLGSVPENQISRKFRISSYNLNLCRRRLGIQSYRLQKMYATRRCPTCKKFVERPNRKYCSWECQKEARYALDPELVKALGTVTDDKIAARFGKPRSWVSQIRRQLGIASVLDKRKASRRLCTYCKRTKPKNVSSEAKYCGKRCRKLAWGVARRERWAELYGEPLSRGRPKKSSYKPRIYRSKWSDEWCQRAIRRVEKLWNPAKAPEQQGVMKIVAAEFGITKSALIGRIWRYKERKRVQAHDKNPYNSTARTKEGCTARRAAA